MFGRFFKVDTVILCRHALRLHSKFPPLRYDKSAQRCYSIFRAQSRTVSLVPSEASPQVKQVGFVAPTIRWHFFVAVATLSWCLLIPLLVWRLPACLVATLSWCVLIRFLAHPKQSSIANQCCACNLESMETQINPFQESNTYCANAVRPRTGEKGKN